MDGYVLRKQSYQWPLVSTINLASTEPSSLISSFWKGWKLPQKAEKSKAQALLFLFPGSHPATAQKNFSYNLPFKFLL